MPRTLPSLSAALLLTVASAALRADDGYTPSGAMMQFPDVSATSIVFSYANDLWIAPRTGGEARPLASPPGPEAFARFSPDGKTIAFVGNYEGGRDIYTIPTDGGLAQRVTYHPDAEVVSDWTPDGKILFFGSQSAGLPRQDQIFTVSPEGGLPARLPVPYGAFACISPDGQWLAYTPHTTDFRTWKRYRGGMATDIWLFNLGDNSSRRVTNWEGTDTSPMWHGSMLYYLSDEGEGARQNIWSFDPRTGQKTRLTAFTEQDIKFPAVGPGPSGKGEIVFQYGSELHLLDLATGKSAPVKITIPGDRPTLRAQQIDFSKHIASGSISPTGKRAIVEARGDLWSLPAKKGVTRALTRTSGIAERNPVWSPDGRWIAYLSDESGEYDLYLRRSDGKGEVYRLTDENTPAPRVYRYLRDWAPDSKKLIMQDKGGGVYLVTLPESLWPVEKKEEKKDEAKKDDGATDEAKPDDAPSADKPADSAESPDEEPAGDDDEAKALPTAAEAGRATVELIATEPWAGLPAMSWSHDSRWLAMALGNDNQHNSIWVYNLETKEKTRITDPFFNADQPAFDRKGDWLYFTSQRSFAPAYSDIDGTYIYENSGVLLAAPLRKDVKSPWLAVSDEEEAWAPKDDDKKDDDSEDKNGEDDAEAPKSPIHGVWKGVVKGPPEAQFPADGFPMTVTIIVSDDGSIRGFNEAMGETTDYTSITFDEATGEIVFEAEAQGMKSTSRGKLEGDTMKGTWEIPALSLSGTWELSRTDEKPDESKAGGSSDKPLVIDFEGIEQRTMQLPVPAGAFFNLSVADSGALLYVRFASTNAADMAAGPSIRLYDMTSAENAEKGERSVLASGGYSLSADGKKLLVFQGEGGAIVDAAPSQTIGDRVPTDRMKGTVNPREEWAQIFMDVWRIQRDFFYEPTMHGVDWPAVREQYRAMLKDCVTRENVSYVVSEMISELNVGHAYYWGGDVEEQTFNNVGMLGCDYELVSTPEGTAYRIGRIINGSRWDSDARSPLSEPGVDVKEGDYLLAVNGQPVDTARAPWAAFEGLAGVICTITVSDKPVIDDAAREVLVRPVGDEIGVRYRDWIERNRAYVDQKSGGKVGYIYVPNTGIDGQNDLYRQFYGQRDKQALIIDERWNGGGQIPNRFIELLNRPRLNYWARRDGKDWPWPPDSHQGPKCMLINGLAGSGGDMFPALFRQVGLGKLIGTRTWGGLVGISGNPSLVDGGYTAVPTFGYYQTDGTWGIEGHGVDPDIEVIDDPARMVNGGDPQLDAAIELMLSEIQRVPYVPAKRPPSPDRKGMGISEQDK